MTTWNIIVAKKKVESHLGAELKELWRQLAPLFHVDWIHGQRARRLFESLEWLSNKYSNSSQQQKQEIKKNRAARKRDRQQWSGINYIIRLFIWSYLIIGQSPPGLRRKCQGLCLFLLETKGFARWQHFFYSSLWPDDAESVHYSDIKRTIVCLTYESLELKLKNKPSEITLCWLYLMRPRCDGFGRVISFNSTVAFWQGKQQLIPIQHVRRLQAGWS